MAWFLSRARLSPLHVAYEHFRVEGLAAELNLQPKVRGSSEERPPLAGRQLQGASVLTNLQTAEADATRVLKDRSQRWRSKRILKKVAETQRGGANSHFTPP
jgi:hypothetical protein